MLCFVLGFLHYYRKKHPTCNIELNRQKFNHCLIFQTWGTYSKQKKFASVGFLTYLNLQITKPIFIWINYNSPHQTVMKVWQINQSSWELRKYYVITSLNCQIHFENMHIIISGVMRSWADQPLQKNKNSSQQIQLDCLDKVITLHLSKMSCRCCCWTVNGINYNSTESLISSWTHKLELHTSTLQLRVFACGDARAHWAAAGAATSALISD